MNRMLTPRRALFGAALGLLVSAPLLGPARASQEAKEGEKVVLMLKAKKDNFVRYTTEGTPEGLVKGKKVYIVAARGGKYTGTPMDVQTPYLKMFLGFLGMTDVTVVRAEGLAIPGVQDTAVQKGLDSVTVTA